MEARADEVPAQAPTSYSIIKLRGSDIIWATPSQYLGVVMSRWLRSLRFGNDYFRLIDQESYFQTYDQYIKSVLVRPETVVSISVASDNHDVVYGWCVSEGMTLHYVHVQQDYRRNGVAQSLIPKDINTITHITKDWLKIWQSKYPALRFNPFK